MHKRIVILTLALSAIMSYGYAQKNALRTIGYASYYHDRFHGRRMANGQLYHRDSLTCAHLKFPLGTMLRVRNIKTGKEITVRVTDRGPYSDRFIVDLSYRAARELEVIGSAKVEVELTPLGDIFIPFRISKVQEDSTFAIPTPPPVLEQTTTIIPKDLHIVLPKK